MGSIIKHRPKVLLTLAVLLGAACFVVSFPSEAYANSAVGGGYPSGKGSACDPGSVCTKVNAEGGGGAWYRYRYNGSLTIPRYSSNIGTYPALTITQCGDAPYVYIYQWVYSGFNSSGKYASGEGIGRPSIGNANGTVYYSGKLGGNIQDGTEVAKKFGRDVVSWEYAMEQYQISWDNNQDYFMGGNPEGAIYTRDEFSNRSSRLSWFCYWGEAQEDPPTPSVPDPDPLNCKNQYDAYGTQEGVYVYGRTTAEAAVRNMSQTTPSFPNGVWYATGAAGDDRVTEALATVYARPGDSIQFRHTVCYGAYLMGNSDANHFKITAAATDSVGEKYAFGDNDVNKELTVTLGNYSSFSNTIKADVRSNLGFRIYSPSLNPSVGTKYRCNNRYAFGTSNPFHEPGYQIPGFLEGDCNAIRETTYSNDAGKVISQTINYDSVKSHITYHHEIKEYCGRLSANANIPVVNANSDAVYVDFAEYLDFYAALEAPGKWGFRPNTGEGAKCELQYDDVSLTYAQAYSEGLLSQNEIDYAIQNNLWGSSSGHSKKVPSEYKLVEGPINYRELQHNPREGNGMSLKRTAEAVIPYNFTTGVQAQLGSSGVRYPGESVNTEFSWSIVARINTLGTSTNYNYATITPADTKVRLIEYILPASTTDPIPGNDNWSGSDPCSFFSGNTGCNIIWSDSPTMSQDGEQNPNGIYGGAGKTVSQKRVIPDNTEIGAKYCIATAIYPSDSHGDPNASIINQAAYGYIGTRGMTGTTWNISESSCVTIAKKPTFETWGAGVYTKGSITTSISRKQVGASWGTYSPNGTFGSWDEFAVIARGEVKGFASAAGFGYLPSTQASLPAVSGNPSAYTPNTSYTAKGGASATATLCDVSKLTIAKTGCVNDKTGSSGIGLTSTIIQRFQARYTDDSVPAKSSGYQITNAAIENESSNALGTTIKYLRINGNATITEPIYMPTSGQNTLVIHATGNVAINYNICYGDSTCRLNDSANNYLRGGNKLKDGEWQVALFDNVSNLPQVLIFAGSISISENVSQLDSWLIATGTINTCSEFVANLPASQYGSSIYRCGTTLNINGPVYAGDLKLYRTAGAQAGAGWSDSDNPVLQNLANDQSMAPAEIFNLRPDTYFWAYSQAERYSQAIVTYIRELAPRY